MRALILALALAAVGCKSLAYQCATDSECGAGGRCEASSFCSFVDPACGSGRRYGEWAGNSLGNECVADDRDAGVDAEVDAPDAPPNAITVSFGETGNATFASVTTDCELTVGGTMPTNLDHASVEVDYERALFRFNINAIPASAIVVSARVELETTRDGNILSAGTAHIYRILEAWDETVVTYFMRTATAAWTAPGCAAPDSRDPAVLASFAPVVENRFSVNLPQSLVQGWVSTPNANHGFLVDTTGSGHLHITTKDGPPERRPLLVVVYVP